MNEKQAAAFFLARAVEGADTSGTDVPMAVRERATEEASRGCEEALAAAAKRRRDNPDQPLTPDEEAFLARRAELIAGFALDGRPRLGKACWVVAAAAAVLGVASNQIGNAHFVHLLSPPMLGIVAWNFVAYAVFLLMAIFARSGAGLSAGLVRIAVHGRTGPAWRRFVADWLPFAMPLYQARVRGWLHVAAALFAGGAIAGLYARGVIVDFRVGWESTFLSAETVQGILAAVLGPASWLTGLPIPDGAVIETLRVGEGSAAPGSAAVWIHLYAVTVALAVVVPRSLLALWTLWRASRLARNVFSPDPRSAGVGRLLRTHLAGERRVLIVPYGHELDADGADAAMGVVRDRRGGRCVVELRDPVAYGEEDSLRADPGLAGCEVAVAANLASTPELEAHGVLIEAARAAGGMAADEPTLILLDGRSLRARCAGPIAAKERVDSRLAAWRGILHALPVEIALLDADLLHADV